MSPLKIPRHEPGLIHTWTFDQDKVWVDVHGVEHVIEEMPTDYIWNVIAFLMRNAGRFARAYSSVALRNDPDYFDPEAFAAVAGCNPQRWLLDKPLLRALLEQVV